MNKRKNPTIVFKIDKDIKSRMTTLALHSKNIDPEIKELAIKWRKLSQKIGYLVEEMEVKAATIKILERIKEEQDGEINE
jgi:hypothetical protein